jgi:hypothetical protein
MSAVVTSIDAATGGVTVYFTAPDANSDTITAYKIEVGHGASSWSEEATSCDGSSSAVMTAMGCTIPMSALRAAPFSLTYA